MHLCSYTEVKLKVLTKQKENVKKKIHVKKKKAALEVAPVFRGWERGGIVCENISIGG
jgi:hypothetical protein